MTQHWNDMPQVLALNGSLAPTTPFVLEQYPRNTFNGHSKPDFDTIPRADSSFSVEDGKNAELSFRLHHGRSTREDPQARPTGASSHHATTPVILHHMTSNEQTLQDGSGDRFLEPIAPNSTSQVSQNNSQADISSAFQQIVFNGTVDVSTTHRRGRTGPQTPDSRTRTKSVKDAGGACWRCKFVGKACDGEDPCKSCPQKATSWQALGCRRGVLSDVLPEVVLCPQAQATIPPSSIMTDMDDTLTASINEKLLQHISRRDLAIANIESNQDGLVFQDNDQSSREVYRETRAAFCMGSNPNGPASEAARRDAPRTKLLRRTVMSILWELEHNSSRDRIFLGMPLSSESPVSSLSKLLSCAARYELDAANDRLIEVSLLCLRACLEAIYIQESEPKALLHATCEPSRCKINAFAKLNTCLKDYLELLSKVIFKKNAKLRKDWWLSVFYSFCIQSYVRRALIVLVAAVDQTPATEYLHLAVQLFFVTCNAAAKGYDPVSYDFENLALTELSALTHHYLKPSDAALAQVAVEKTLWEEDEIDSSYDYLGRLFNMNRDIFVPPTARPHLHGDGTVSRPLIGDTEGVVDEATRPPAKKRCLDCRNKDGYISDESIATQIPDTHIIHPGSLALLSASDELPPPSAADDDDFIVRENESRFEGDMYAPHWIRDFEFGSGGAEGWCGFCSRWFKLNEKWFNDRCLFHGICTETGKGFPEPKEPVRVHPLKQIWEAKCEKCGVTVKYRKNDRRHYSAWYVHAANCGNQSLPEVGELNGEAEDEDDMAILESE